MLTPIKIDLEKLKSDMLNESFVAQFAADVKYVLGHILAKPLIPSIYDIREAEEESEESDSQLVIKGSKKDLKIFADVIDKEKDYALKYLEFGLGNPEVTDSKMELEKSIYDFEKETGLKWPLR
jgi:hypothetical protein